MAQLKGDFISFSFNGKSSSELGIVRTSDGDRYNHNLSPQFEDKTIEIPGGDGAYYFGSTFSVREFNIPIAFDSLTENEFKNLNVFFNDKKIHDLIFDEAPYKVYKAKISEPPELEFICFDDLENEGERVYKGEGTINFIAYTPWARSQYKYLDSYDSDIYTSKDEWAEASGLAKNQATKGCDVFSNGTASLYNPGDLEADYQLFIPVNGGNITISLNNSEIMILQNVEVNGSEDGICIDTKTQLINGYIHSTSGTADVYRLTTNLYNNKIKLGSFVKIPKGDSTMTITGATDTPAIVYDYLYF